VGESGEEPFSMMGKGGRVRVSEESFVGADSAKEMRSGVLVKSSEWFKPEEDG
jgi:hypothetical protein